MQEEAILEFSYDAVYYVHSDDPNIPLSPIAIRPYLREGYVGWEDTIRGRLFRVTDIKIISPSSRTTPFPEKIELKVDDRSTKIELVWLSCPIYEAKVRDNVIGNLSFDQDLQLQNYYLTTNFYSV